jgi:2-polyprenyl-6-methoxyphenol hydroxylase-like FAD-dependent oxidoreductase
VTRREEGGVITVVDGYRHVRDGAGWAHPIVGSSEGVTVGTTRGRVRSTVLREGLFRTRVDGRARSVAAAETSVGPAAFIGRVRHVLRQADDRLDRALDAVSHADDTYFWPLTDRRSATWATGRVVLLGDAAAGFLPTAGIGAGMAIESAGVLASHLRTTTAPLVPAASEDYERAQRPRVEAAQQNSRSLARLLFHRSRLLATARDTAVRFLPMRSALGPTRAILDQAPDVRHGVTEVPAEPSDDR